MEWAKHRCITIIIGILLLFFSCLSSIEQEALPLWSDMDGYGVTNSNIICEMESCSYCTLDDCSQRDKPPLNVDSVYHADYLVVLLSFLTHLFACEIVSAKAGCSEEKLPLCSQMTVSIVILTIIFSAFIAALWCRIYTERIRMRDKVPKKIDDRGPLGQPDYDREERSASEALPLHMMVRLKKTLSAEDTVLSTARRKKHGCHFPEHDHPAFHYFQFRREQQFVTTINAYPTTVTFASHFVSGSFQQPSSSQDLHKEGVRLATFKDFPPTVPVSALRLAQAGFYYLGERDQVKCFSCGQTYGNWQLGEKPTSVHARISPNCSLVRGSEMTNVPLPLPLTSLPSFADTEPSMESGYGSALSGTTSLTGPGSSPTGPSSLTGPGSAGTQGPGSDQPGSGHPMTAEATDRGQLLTSTGASNVTTNATRSQSPELSTLTTSIASVAMDSVPAPGPSSVATSESSASSLDGGAPRNPPLPSRRLDLGGAVYPLYSQLDARRRSFNSWIAQFPPVDELVTLGFFYAGYADCVRCFFCGIGLKSWETQDIPAEVHARWRPTCEYLRLVKGDEYVDTIANGVENVADRANRDSVGGAGQGSGGGSSRPGQGTSPALPDTPVVHRAQQSGYTDTQIAEAIEKLRIIGMEGAMEVMLLEILINLFSDAGSRRNGEAPSAGAADNPPPSDGDMQNDGADEAPAAAALDEGALQDRHLALQQENERLRSLRTCQRCQERQVGVIFLPCGHIIACTECAPSIRRCTRCDSVIRATANVFFS